MGANTSKCARSSPAAVPPNPPAPIQNHARNEKSEQHPPTYEEATYSPISPQEPSAAHELEREASSSSSSSASEVTTVTGGVGKMTDYQKEAYRSQRKAEKRLARAQRRVEKARRKADKTEIKFAKRVDKLSSKADKAAAKVHTKATKAAEKVQTKAMRSADKAHMKAVKRTAKAQKKADIAAARANAVARAAQASAEISSARIGMRGSTPSISALPHVRRATSESHLSPPAASPVVGTGRPRRVTINEGDTPSSSQGLSSRRNAGYEPIMLSPRPEHQQHTPFSGTATPPSLGATELLQTERRQQHRKSQLESEYAQLEHDRVQLDRDVLSRQILDIYAGIGKLQMGR